MSENKTTQDRPSVNESSNVKEKDPLERFVGGYMGLATTFWVYGVLSVPVWLVLLTALRPEGVVRADDLQVGILNLAEVAFVIYIFSVFVAVWRAATRYEGVKAWAVLAKFLVLMLAIPLIIHCIRFATR